MREWLVDTHCHLTLTARKIGASSLKDLLQTMDPPPQMLDVACHPEEFEKSSQWLERDPRLYGAFGVHPHDASLYNDHVEQSLLKYLRHPKAVAVGETGLDYHYEYSPRPAQKEAFRRQLRLARQLNLPVVIHTREAEQDTLDILRQENAGDLPLHIHCFTGSMEFARSLLELGPRIYFGFTGIITFKNAEPIRQVARFLPAERILTETDSPFLAPVPYRGQTATPSMVLQVIESLAALRQIAVERLAVQCRENARKFYGF